MGAESCTIDLETSSLTIQQMEKAERLANEVIAQDRPVGVRFVPLEEARELGLRKLPPKQAGDLRLIEHPGVRSLCLRRNTCSCHRADWLHPSSQSREGKAGNARGICLRAACCDHGAKRLRHTD